MIEEFTVTTTLTFADQERLSSTSIPTALYPTFINSYEDFLSFLYTKIDEVIVDMQRHSTDYENHSETQVTGHIASHLRLSFHFSAEANDRSGNTDLTVSMPGKSWEWIGEAKFDNGYTYIAGGFKQLTTRYVSCEPYEREGGILIFCKTHSIATFMNQLRENFEKSSFLKRNKLLHHEINIKDCHLRKEYSFFSSSLLPQIGGDIRYRTRFIPVALLHLPEDDSAMKSEKHKKKREEVAKGRMLAKNRDTAD